MFIIISSYRQRHKVNNNRINIYQTVIRKYWRTLHHVYIQYFIESSIICTYV